MYLIYFYIQFTVVVFQRSTTISLTQRTQENTKKSGTMDHRSISNLSYLGY